MQFHSTARLATLAITTALLCACTPSRAPAQVTVRNATPETIVELTLEVSEQHLASENLAPGASITVSYSIGVESNYHVVAKFASGKMIDTAVGYVDAGLNSHDSLVVFADHIDFEPQVSAAAAAHPSRNGS